MGFLGSAHCFGMCGGIAGAFSAVRAGEPAAGASARDLQRALATNLGRMASYSAAGAIAGTLGASLIEVGGPGTMLVLRALAAVLIVAAGLYVAGWSTVVLRVERLGASLWRRIAPLAARTRASASLASAIAFGALWGWLPCGLVYSALAVAAAAGSASGGAMVMAAFGLGTLPATLAIALLSGRGAGLLRAHSTRRLAGAMVVAFGLWTFASAAMSFANSSTDAAACHRVASHPSGQRIADAAL